MGASSSVRVYTSEEDGKIYKKSPNCKCIFSCNYENYICTSIELPYCCYTCLENLREKTYDTDNLYYLIKETKGIRMQDAIEESKWLSEYDAVQYAIQNKIHIQEFLTNTDILSRYHIST
jgi:hypothetical protein